jgi:hypothetical protein
MFISKIFTFSKYIINNILDSLIYLTTKIDNCLIYSYNTIFFCCPINNANVQYEQIEEIETEGLHIREPKKSKIPILDRFHFVSKQEYYS